MCVNIYAIVCIYVHHKRFTCATEASDCILLYSLLTLYFEKGGHDVVLSIFL